MAARQRYIIAYDVTDNRLRHKLVSLLLDYGVRAQYSIFQCDLTEGQYARLFRQMQNLLADFGNAQGMKKVVIWRQRGETCLGNMPEAEPPGTHAIIL